AICVALGLAWTIFAFRFFRPMWQETLSSKSRFLRFAGTGVVAIALFLTVPFNGTRFSPDRTLNELANNGSISFINAAWTRNLDYAAHYRTLSRDEAYARVRQLLAAPNAEFVGDEQSIRRRIGGDTNRPQLNVVL